MAASRSSSSRRTLPSFMGSSATSCSIFPQPRLLAARQTPHCPLIELLEIKKTKLTKSGEISSQYLCLYEAWRNSYPWLPLPGDMAVCMLEELARPWVGVCVPLACEQQTHFHFLVCPLLFVCVAGMGYFRVTLLQASVSKRG